MERLNLEFFNKQFFPLKPLIVILGPTASGKTSAAIELTEYVDIEIISADSRQIFKYLDIGTAKPTSEELAAAKHHFIDIVEPDEYYSAGVFGKAALETASDIFSRGKLPVVAGGSGLFIKALCDGFFDDDDYDNDNEIREKLNYRMEIEGRDMLYGELSEIDPDSADRYNDRNPRRILRALEYFYTTGKKFSDAFELTNKQNIFKPIYFGIEYKREELYSRINQRTEIMWKSGLIEETESLLQMGFSPDLNSLNTVGYKECIDFLNKNLTLTEAIEKTQQNTRRYAKRQLTWFRRNTEINWLNPKNGSIGAQIYKLLVIKKPI